MTVGDLTTKIITMYPTTLSPNDNARIAYALSDYVRELKIKRLNPRKRAWINVTGFRAELPNDMDLGGSLWVFACINDRLYTIDIINNKKCPNGLKPQKLCECSNPKVKSCDCGCGDVKAACCESCGNTIGYMLSGNTFGVYTSGLGWGGVWVAQAPFGHALMGNPYGNVQREGNQLIFDTCFPCDGVFIDYEQTLAPSDSPIDDIYTLSVEYYVLGRLLDDTDPVLAEVFMKKYLIAIDNIKTMKFLNAINPDTLLRVARSGFGLVKSP